MHLLLFLIASIMYMLVVRSFIIIVRRNALVSLNPALLAVFIVSGAAIATSLADTVFIFIKRKRKATSILLGVCFLVLFIFLMLSLIIYGTDIIFIETRVYLPIMCALLAVSIVFGYAVSGKILKNAKNVKEKSGENTN